ncbi:MAG: DUF11 domain-containing protein [Methanomicrobiales archaeon]|nr:DUF11 domain-containing protein [Methanomicrobiales archaeon]
MKKSCVFHLKALVILLLLFAGVNAVSAAVDLSMSKTPAGGPCYVGDGCVWRISVYNEGPDDAFNITVLDEIDEKGIFGSWSGDGEFNVSNGEWFIETLGNRSYANLSIDVMYETNGTHCNSVMITSINDSAPEETDSDPSNNYDTACVDLARTVSVNLVIKPETLNLNSRGVFSVFIDVEGIGDSGTVDLNDINITCGEAILRKLMPAGAVDGDEENGDAVKSNRQRIIAKFERTHLNTTAGDAVEINCTGYVTVGGERIKVEGSDTIRVIHEKRLSIPFLNRLLAFFGISTGSDEEVGGETAYEDEAVPDIPYRNLGQAKKSMKEVREDKGGSGEEVGQETFGSEKGRSDEERGGGMAEEKGKKRPDWAGSAVQPQSERNRGNAKNN